MGFIIRFGKLMQHYFRLKLLELWVTTEHMNIYVYLEPITSEDGMTADFYEFKKSFMQTISNKIVNSIRGINRVVYDVTSKPPSTIELE